MKRTIKSRVREEKVLSDKKMKGRRLRALCTAVILGSVTLGGLSAHAVDISNQSDLINPGNYTDGSTLNILNPINITDADFRDSISGAVKVVIDGGNNEIYGGNIDEKVSAIWSSDQESGDDSLETGHYTIQANGAEVTFQNINWNTSTEVHGDAYVGSGGRSWNIDGGIVQNQSGKLNVTDSSFSTNLSISLNRQGNYASNTYINGGIIDNFSDGAGTTGVVISGTNFNSNNISVNAVRVGSPTDWNSGAEAHAEINGGILRNAVCKHK